MLNMGRRDRLFDPKDADKGGKPFPAGTGTPPPAALPVGRGGTPGPLTRDAATAAAAAAPTPLPSIPTPPPTPAPEVAVALAPTPAADIGTTSIGPEMPGSRLCVGPKIKLKGVEISDCDVLVVEGEVEATVNSKAMQIAKPGTLKGHVAIDVAEIFGDFTGELTARSKLIVHGTGRVSGKIRYGKLIVAEGGEVSGDVQRLDAGTKAAPARPPSNEAFSLATQESTS